MGTGRQHSPLRVFVGPLHRVEFFGQIVLFTRLKQQDFQAVICQNLRRHAAGGA